MQKAEKQWTGPQKKSKCTRKTSKEDPQRLKPVQKKQSPNLATNKQSKSEKFPANQDDEVTHYQTIPERRFPAERAFEIIKQITDEKLATVEYSCACATISKDLADCVKAAVKKLLCDRYKLLCYVAIGQMKDSTVNFSSRAIWSPTADTFTEYVYKKRSLFAVCILFAVYKE